MRTLAAVAALVASTVPVAPAAMAGGSCPTSATITRLDDSNGSDFPSYMMRYSEREPDGQRWSGSSVDSSHFYGINGERLTLDFDGVRIVVWSDAVFRLDCAGMPDVQLLRGTADVHTDNAVPGRVTTEEGTVRPAVPDARMFFSVHRKLAESSLTADDRLRWFHNSPDQPTGRTRAIGTDNDKISVTPNVGSRPGDPRHVIRCVMVTTTSYGHGTAAYYNTYRHG